MLSFDVKRSNKFFFFTCTLNSRKKENDSQRQHNIFIDSVPLKHSHHMRTVSVASNYITDLEKTDGCTTVSVSSSNASNESDQKKFNSNFIGLKKPQIRLTKQKSLNQSPNEKLNNGADDNLPFLPFLPFLPTAASTKLLSKKINRVISKKLHEFNKTKSKTIENCKRNKCKTSKSSYESSKKFFYLKKIS